MVSTDVLADAVRFVKWADGLKSVERESSPVGLSRPETSAEHSWHACLAALVLAPVLAPDVDATHAIELLVVHDLVEVFAGDTYVYGPHSVDQRQREDAAARQMVSEAPAAVRKRLEDLWAEFATAATPEARFAKAVDAALPVLLNAANGGVVWTRLGTPLDRVRTRIRSLTGEYPELERMLLQTVDELEGRDE